MQLRHFDRLYGRAHSNIMNTDVVSSIDERTRNLSSLRELITVVLLS